MKNALFSPMALLKANISVTVNQQLFSDQVFTGNYNLNYESDIVDRQPQNINYHCKISGVFVSFTSKAIHLK